MQRQRGSLWLIDVGARPHMAAIASGETPPPDRGSSSILLLDIANELKARIEDILSVSYRRRMFFHADSGAEGRLTTGHTTQRTAALSRRGQKIQSDPSPIAFPLSNY